MSSSSDLVPRPSPDRTADLVHNLQDIRDRVRRAASTSSSTSNGAQIKREPTLVAVSKYKPASDVLACYDAGQRDFGENYVQELVDKAAALPDDIRWHFIGTLQSNKAKLLASIPNIDTVQTLTSAKAATALNNGLPPSRPSSSPLNILIQVNTSGEAAKSGVSPPDSDESSDSKNNDLIDLARHILNRCPRLRLRGLMTIGSLERSLDASAGEENADFARLIRARDALREALEAEFGPDADGRRRWGDDGQGIGLVLSMGMSADFEAALVAGSDIVRVGTGIFGERRKKGEVVEG